MEIALATLIVFVGICAVYSNRNVDVWKYDYNPKLGEYVRIKRGEE